MKDLMEFTLNKKSWNDLPSDLFIYSLNKNKDSEKLDLYFHKPGNAKETFCFSPPQSYIQFGKNLDIQDKTEKRLLDSFSNFIQLNSPIPEGIYVGTFENKNYAKGAIEKGMYLYRKELTDSLKPVGFKNVKLNDYVFKKYIFPLASFFDKEKKYNGIKKDFLNFAKNTGFEKNVFEIFENIEKNQKKLNFKPDMDFLKYQSLMIDYINRDDFENVKFLNDQYKLFDLLKNE